MRLENNHRLLVSPTDVQNEHRSWKQGGDEISSLSVTDFTGLKSLLFDAEMEQYTNESVFHNGKAREYCKCASNS